MPDGAPVVLTPESAIETQQMLGTDIMMALDECTPFPADHARAQGAILGKAMSSLESGEGMVLVLVTLQ